MGEIAEMMLEGCLCECCGDFLGDGDGYPRRCCSCQKDEPETKGPRFPARKGKKPMIQCKMCKKWVKVAGLQDHARMVHGGRFPDENN